MASVDVSELAESHAMGVLRTLAEAAGVEFDPTLAAKALRQAEHEIPPTQSRAARQRLILAAEALGMQILLRKLSVREAIQEVAEAHPLAVFSVNSQGVGRWHLLAESDGSRGKLEPLPGDRDLGWMSPESLALELGAEDADEVLEWLTAHRAAPLATATRPAEESPEHMEPHSAIPPVTRLWGLLVPEMRDVWIVVLYAIAVGVLSLATPITVMAVVNTAAMATLIQQLLVLCIILLACLGLAAFLRLLQYIIVEYMQRRIFVRVAVDLAHRLPRVELKAFDRAHGPELVNRFFDVLTVQKASATLLLDGVNVVLQTSIGLVLLAFYHQFLLGFDILLIGALLFILFVLGRGAVRTAIRESRAKYRVASWLEEIARHPLTFKLSGGPRFVMERADMLARDYLHARHNHFIIVLRQVGSALALQALASTALLGLGGYLVIIGQLTLGQLVAAEIVVSAVVASFTKLGKQLESWYDLQAAVDKLGILIDLPLEREDGAVHHDRSLGASVLVRQVSFRYEDHLPWVLHNFDLEIRPGERVAVLGPNGAGKSTLIDLLFGLRRPTSGYIAIDGEDIRSLRLESLRQHIAVVKGMEIFEGTVLDNVRMGREELTLADIRDALQRVDLLDDILNLPDGLNTRLGTGGAPLSLGMAERLVLARAIVGQPRLLILDELLDDMDQEVRKTVLPAIVGKDAHWTLIVITHSQEVARLCDRQIHMSRVAAAGAA
ncbi:MAG: ATP-binding cassette domain-containing protein [Gemmatales bacterium]|nr:ATP-binding cassette domain-containing protein [Gemmatales bacterium]MDW8386912.1 ATP-binding cassette domain-containing protein [Gemmatales bacterium]